jgi:hypothetical protein
MTILTPAYIRLLKESAGYYCLFTKITGLPLKFLQSSVCLKGCCGLLNRELVLCFYPYKFFDLKKLRWAFWSLKLKLP